MVCFWIFDFNGFWLKNYVINLTAKYSFRLLKQVIRVSLSFFQEYFFLTFFSIFTRPSPHQIVDQKNKQNLPFGCHN